jgi:hypothetical protein
VLDVAPPGEEHGHAVAVRGVDFAGVTGKPWGLEKVEAFRYLELA